MNVLISGPAGSGKTLLTSEFGSYLEGNFSVRYVNLDAGVLNLPYEPDFDIRNFFTLEEIMKDQNLGPNGATLVAVDRLPRLDIPQFSDDFVLIDTPGQLEPFVFRSGYEVFRNLAEISIFLLDGTAPLATFPSQYLYSLAAQYALDMPMVRALNKIDLLEEERIAELEKLVMDPRIFRSSGDFEMRSQINMDIADILTEMHSPSKFPFVSAEKHEGFEDLMTYLLESVRTKEDFDPEFPYQDL
jgi:hypothetical protein